MATDVIEQPAKSRDLRRGDVIQHHSPPHPRRGYSGRLHPVEYASPQVVDRRKDDDSGWWLTDGSGLADHAFEAEYAPGQRYWTLIER